MFSGYLTAKNKVRLSEKQSLSFGFQYFKLVIIFCIKTLKRTYLENIFCYYMPIFLFSDIIDIIMFNNSREISEDILQDLTSELGKYLLSCLNDNNKIV